jgi:hypothetical protein
MQTTESNLLLTALRRAVAVVEFAAAGLFLLLALDGFTTGEVGGGCAGSLADGIMKMFALPSLLISFGVGLVAFKGWRGGGRRWWTWQCLMLLWVVVAPIASLILLASLSG